MLIAEHPWEGNANLICHSSDSGKMIEQVETGVLYAEAVDVYPPRFTYRETEQDIEQEEIENG